jgi:hypothetical protein
MSIKELKVCECCGNEFKPTHKNHKYCTSRCLASMSNSKPKLITRDQVNEWCKRQGMAVVPIEPTRPMVDAGCKAIWSPHLSHVYKAMIKAAQESG